MAALSQATDTVNLEWICGDPISLAFTAVGVDWTGTYTAQIRDRPGDGILLGALTVTATLAGADTAFTMTMSAADSADIGAGTYSWDLQQTAGVTRLRGQVRVKGQVSQP